jgi:hypothetical protein
MCLWPFIVKWELCGCTAYRVMHTCSDAGSGVFAICCKSLYEATQEQNILEEIWEKESGGCPICTKYAALVRSNNMAT